MSRTKNILKATLRDAVIRFGSIRRNRGAPKKALLSFIIHPLLYSNQNHPNALELDLILSALEELGYEVTVIDYRRKHLGGRYDLCIGFGTAFEMAMQRGLADAYVLYATGLSFPTQIMATMTAMARVAARGEVRRDESAGLVRLPEALWPMQLAWSDAVLAIGGTYSIRDHETYCSAPIIPAPGLCFRRADHAELRRAKDFDAARRHFAWFGGPGFSHKGLDLCIDYFLAQPEIDLHIAGAVAIPDAYRRLVDAAPNIHLVGYLKIGSDAFRTFAERCGFVVLPSISEAMATSIVTMMVNGGLVPVVSRQSAFDLPEGSGIMFDAAAPEGLHGAMQHARGLSAVELAQWSAAAEDHALKHFTPEVFRAAVIKAVETGIVAERRIPQTVSGPGSPGVLDTISQWIKS